MLSNKDWYGCFKDISKLVFLRERRGDESEVKRDIPKHLKSGMRSMRLLDALATDVHLLENKLSMKFGSPCLAPSPMVSLDARRRSRACM